MKTYVTSDIHFGHTNIMKFCPATRARFKDDVKFMDEEIIREWNEIVEPGDLTYILGDVAFHNAQKATEIMRRLNGRKILVAGNHDRKTLQSETFRNEFVSVQPYLDINYEGHKVVMSHYPFLEWDQMHRGSLHFFGHLHGGKTGMENYRCMDVGIDSTGEIVISLDRAIRMIKDNEIKKHHN